MLSDHSDADVCFWKEQPDKDRQYYFFVRVLYIEKMEEIFNYGELGKLHTKNKQFNLPI